MEERFVSHVDPVDNPRLTGAALALKVRKMSVAQRSALAARLVRGEVSIAGFIPTQAAALAKVSAGGVRLANRATDEDRAALKRGRMSLSQLRAKHRKPLSDSAIRAFIHSAGIERVMGTIDEMTAPHQLAAAE
jgi:hypothetical protein